MMLVCLERGQVKVARERRSSPDDHGANREGYHCLRVYYHRVEQRTARQLLEAEWMRHFGRLVLRCSIKRWKLCESWNIEDGTVVDGSTSLSGATTCAFTRCFHIRRDTLIMLAPKETGCPRLATAAATRALQSRCMRVYMPGEGMNLWQQHDNMFWEHKV